MISAGVKTRQQTLAVHSQGVTEFPWYFSEGTSAAHFLRRNLTPRTPLGFSQDTQCCWCTGASRHATCPLRVLFWVVTFGVLSPGQVLSHSSHTVGLRFSNTVRFSAWTDQTQPRRCQFPPRTPMLSQNSGAQNIPNPVPFIPHLG